MATKIRQCFVSNALAHFKDHFMRNHGLIEYSDPNKPAIFFGCYGQQNFDIINRHKGLAVIVWGGSDAMHPRFVRDLGRKGNTRHVALSDYVTHDFRRHRIPQNRRKKIPLIATNKDMFEPTRLGDSVYIYLTMNKRVREAKLYEDVKRKLNGKHKIIEITAYTKLPQVEYSRMLDQCFIGLRLVNHDGLSNTVVELGLKGRKCLWNGGTPNAIPYKNASDVVNAITKEADLIGQRGHSDIAKAVRDYITVDDSWMTEEFWSV